MATTRKFRAVRKEVIVLIRKTTVQHETKCMKAKGIGHEHANPEMIPFEGEGAWADIVVEKQKRLKENEKKIASDNTI